MKRHPRSSGRTAAAALLVLCCATPLVARPQGDPPERDTMREDLQETIEIYMVARMTRFLELTDEQQHAVIPVIEQLNASRREFNHQRRLTLMRLRPMIEDDPADQAAIASILENLDAMESRMRSSEDTAKEAIRKALTPVQQAKFMMFQERFRREMQERLRGLDDRPGPGRRPDQPPPPPPGRRRR